MKIRNGFVSNSSSSSYIIAYKLDKPCKHCGRSDFDVKKFIDERNVEFSKTKLTMKTTKEVVEFLKEEIQQSTDYLAPFYEAAKNGDKEIKTNWGTVEVSSTIQSSEEELASIENLLTLVLEYKEKDNWNVINAEIATDDKVTINAINSLIASNHAAILDVDTNQF